MCLHLDDVTCVPVRQSRIKHEKFYGVHMVLKLKLVAVALLGFAVSSVASAASTSLSGNGFSVAYDSDSVGLFGTPTLVGNLLSFTPDSFKVGTNGGLETFLDAMLGLRVTAAQGYQVDSVSLWEAGTFLVKGADAAFGVVPMLTVTTLDHLGGGTVSGAGEFTGGERVANGGWVAAGPGYTVAGLASKLLQVSLDSTLYASSSASSSFAKATITSAQLTFNVSQVPAVPEPSAYLMLLAGLGMVGVVARRRSAQR